MSSAQFRIFVNLAYGKKLLNLFFSFALLSLRKNNSQFLWTAFVERQFHEVHKLVFGQAKPL